MLRDYAIGGAPQAVRNTAAALAVTEPQVRTAEGYYAAFPAEIDDRIGLNADAADLAAIATALRHHDIDAIAVQQQADLRGLPDDQVFVHAQLEHRCVVTENIADFVAVESAWRAEQVHAHFGLILVAPRAFPRHRRGAVGCIAAALRTQADATPPEPGTVIWLGAAES